MGAISRATTLRLPLKSGKERRGPSGRIDHSKRKWVRPSVGTSLRRPLAPETTPWVPLTSGFCESPSWLLGASARDHASGPLSDGAGAPLVAAGSDVLTAGCSANSIPFSMSHNA